MVNIADIYSEKQLKPINTKRGGKAQRVRLKALPVDLERGPLSLLSTTEELLGRNDHLCGLVVRVPGYKSRGPGSIPGAT
jgi:hypothetical protein